MTKREFDNNDDGAEIARQMGITRQAVSNTLKRAMKKVYNETNRLNPDNGPFQSAIQIMKMLEVDKSEDVNKFFHLFPPDIRSEIKMDILNTRSKRKSYDSTMSNPM
jgi:predicted DNA-binding protein YlxM (UPF0122 family)